VPQPIIFPLREKLAVPVFAQQNPRWTGGRRVPALPTLPWEFKMRPQAIGFTQYTLPPVTGSWIGVNRPVISPRGGELPIGVQIAIPSVRSSVRPSVRPSVVHGPLPLPAVFFTMTGVTRDAFGAPLGACNVELFRSVDDVKIGDTTSDASGNFEFRGMVRGALHYVRAYKSGSPDVAGTTAETLVSDQG
jgi:hypothetical protein